MLNENNFKPYEVVFVPKGWGFEKWLVNTDQYCGKVLYFVKDRKCSWHFHKKKDEVFFVQSGRIIITFSNEDSIERATNLILGKGSTFHVYPGLRHQITALEDSEIIEFSTRHEESDSYRVIRGD